MRYIICDLDGTLALTEHRQHFLERKPQEWDRFFLACKNDAPNWPVIWTLRGLHSYFALEDVQIQLMSGRSNIAQQETEDWLSEFAIPYDTLRMREQGDFSPDEVLKERGLDELGKENVVFCIDDRQKVVNMWRAHGLTCFQVAPGAF